MCIFDGSLFLIGDCPTKLFSTYMCTVDLVINFGVFGERFALCFKNISLIEEIGEVFESPLFF